MYCTLGRSLSLAKIDEMGRFVSMFETKPDADKSLLSDLGENTHR